MHGRWLSRLFRGQRSEVDPIRSLAVKFRLRPTPIVEIEVMRDLRLRFTGRVVGILLELADCVESAVARDDAKGLADYSWTNKLIVLTNGNLMLSPVRGITLQYLPRLSTQHSIQHKFDHIVVESGIEKTI